MALWSNGFCLAFFLLSPVEILHRRFYTHASFYYKLQNSSRERERERERERKICFIRRLRLPDRTLIAQKFWVRTTHEETSPGTSSPPQLLRHSLITTSSCISNEKTDWKMDPDHLVKRGFSEDVEAWDFPVIATLSTNLQLLLKFSQKVTLIVDISKWLLKSFNATFQCKLFENCPETDSIAWTKL